MANKPKQVERDRRAKVEEMRLVVAQRESGDAAGALATIRGGIGKDVMDQIRKNLNEAAGEERGLLRERMDVREDVAARATRLILVESLIALLLVGGAAALAAGASSVGLSAASAPRPH